MTSARVRLGRVLAGPLPVLLIALIVTALQVAGRAWPAHDAASYWRAAHTLIGGGDLYPAVWGDLMYAGPPPMAQAFAAVSWLPWPIVLFAWQLVLWAALWYATRPFALPVIAAGWLGLAAEVPVLAAPLSLVLIGNAGMLMTAAVVATVRRPAASAVAALTKIGPSVALLWHASRPRALAVGVGVTLAASAVSFALTPAAWLDWFVFVRDNAGQSPIGESAVPFLVRFPVGVALVLLAAVRGVAWLVPIGAGLAIPADYGLSWVTVWVGALGLLGRERAHVGTRPALTWPAAARLSRALSASRHQHLDNTTRYPRVRGNRHENLDHVL